MQKNNDKQGYAMALMGLSQQESHSGNYTQALKVLLRASDFVRDTLKDSEMLGSVYLTLGILYFDQLDTLRAIAFNKKAMAAYAQTNIPESMGSISNNLGMQYSDLGQYDSAKAYFHKSIAWFQQSDKPGFISNPFINMGALFRHMHQYDSATIYTRQSIRYAIKNNYEESLGGGYFNLAQIFRDLKKADSAMIYYKLALPIFEKINSPTGLRDFYPDLAAFYASQGNSKLAYEYLQKGTALKDSVFGSESNKRLAQITMQYDYDKKDAAEKAGQARKDIQQRNIRYSIAGALAGALIFLAVVYRQRNKVKKEKARSEELLLNILPAEVAEELKEKGSAAAKHFDNVTVLFTDFKGFTTVSERLSPQQLVDELHACFSGFDAIMHKHNIEKIKTVGDAYLAVCGLPLPNANHAEDMVKAAIEIKEFMAKRRKEHGDKTFEIRIGIHSGSVVAGIVGVKKFSYDIWGDTVNTAARMEQNSEAGKINISETTYELVNAKFTCEYRGEIEAKNKGKLKMYFVG